MLNALTTANTNPLITNLSLVSAQTSSTPGLSAVLNTLPPFLTNTPVLVGNVTAQANAILPPGGGLSSIKNFLSIHGSAGGGASMLAEVSAAVSQFGAKSFGDMGINSSGFHDVLTQGVTSMTPSLGAAASLSTQLPLGSLGSLSGLASGLSSPSSLLSGAGSLATKLGSLVPSPGSVPPLLSSANDTVRQSSSQLTSGVTGLLGTSTSGATGSLPSLPSVSGLVQSASGLSQNLTGAIGSGLPSISAGLGSSMGGLSSALGTKGAGSNPSAEAVGASQLSSDTLNASLASAGTGFQNFGTLFDFSDMPLDAMNMLKSLNEQGLADSLGINDEITSQGFDPTGTVPEEVLSSIYATITDSDLEKVIEQTGVQIVNPVNSLADLLDPSNIMPPDATAALGVSPGSAGLASVSNTFTNLGIQADNTTTGAYIASMSTIPLPNLDKLDQPLPPSVVENLAPSMGTGSGLFGNPTMLDMLGTVAGVVHTDSFTTINSTLEILMNSSAGQNLNSAAEAFLDTLTLSTFASAVATFNSTVVSNSSLQAAVTEANSAYNASYTQMTKEQQNLGLVGVSLFTASGAPVTQPASGGVTSIFNFGSQLHNFGVDKQQLGYNELLNSIATNDLTGDAIRASLLEGRNLAKSYAVGKSTPGVANEQAEIAATQSGTSA
jgi:hypothetical protein